MPAAAVKGAVKRPDRIHGGRVKDKLREDAERLRRRFADEETVLPGNPLFITPLGIAMNN